MNQLYLFGHHILYIGTSFETVMHRHHAAQICIGLDDTFELINEEGLVETYRAVIVTANAAHQLSAPETAIATLFLDIQSETYETLVKQFQLNDSHIFHSLQLSTELLSELNQLHQVSSTNGSAKSTINKMINELSRKEPSTVSLDPRVIEVLQQLNHSVDSQIPLDDLAASVHLSPSRLIHLFKSEVGTPIRRYSLWARIRVAMEYAVSHQSLTGGAHHAGFTDSAHFSRIFKEMYGINPSAIVNKQIPITVNFE